MTEHAETRGRAGRGDRTWLVLTVILLVAAGLIAWMLLTDSAGPERGITVEDVVREPTDYVGERVTVSGEIDDAYFLTGVGDPDDLGRGGIDRQRETPLGELPGGGPGSVVFVLGRDAPGPELLVVDASADDKRALREEAVVQVTGTVLLFDREELEETYGWDLADGGFGDFEDRPVIVASRVERLPRRG